MASAGPIDIDIVAWTPDLDPWAERIIGEVFREFGIGFYPDGHDSDLRHVEECYLLRGGTFSFLVAGGEPVGTVAAWPAEGRSCELRRLYLTGSWRGRGRGSSLLQHALEWARASGFNEMVAWSDTRFERAHELYRRHGFVLFGRRPEPGPDPAEEFGFRKAL